MECKVKMKDVLEQAEYAIAAVGARDDEDLAQTGRLAAIEAAATWQPDKGALSTWVSAQVKGAILKARDRARTEGVGTGRWGSAEHISMSDEASISDDDGEAVTHQDAATYHDTDHVPEGFGDPGREIQRQLAAAAVAELLPEIPINDPNLLRVISGEMTEDEYALWASVNQSTANRRANKLIALAHEIQKTSYIQSTGTRKAAKPSFWNDVVSTVEGNPVWSQKTGRIWNDWSWKPIEEKK